MIYTYLLKSLRDGTYYVGIAKNPKTRLKFHNSGKSLWSKRKMPWELVYSRAHPAYEEARKHEKWLKKKDAAYKQKLESFSGDLSRLM